MKNPRFTPEFKEKAPASGHRACQSNAEGLSGAESMKNHDEAVIEMLCTDPDMAVDYLRTAFDELDEPVVKPLFCLPCAMSLITRWYGHCYCKIVIKSKTRCQMRKRNLFAEIMLGIEDMTAEREDKIILRQITVEVKPVSVVTANETGALRGNNEI